MKSNNTSRWIQGVVLTLSVWALFVQGCTKLNQDPFAGQNDDVKNAQIPHEKPSPTPVPIPTPITVDTSGILQIDHDDFYTFVEGKKTDIQMSGRVLVSVNGHDAVAGVDYILGIDNLADFKGATFDGTSGKFSWTPPMDYVDTDYNKQASMIVTIKMLTGFGYARAESVKIFVDRSISDPVIQAVTYDTSTPIHEGDRRSFTVTVKDPDADDKTPPSLVVTNVVSGANIASYVSSTGAPTRGTSDPSIWTFNMMLDLSNAEVTTSESTLNFAVMSMSPYGHASTPYKVAVRVRTVAANPSMGWSSNLTIPFTGGQDNLYTFSVMDPKSEGKIRVQFNVCAGFGSSATCACQQDQFYSYIANCTIRWKPAANTSGSYNVSGYAYNDSPIAGDTAGSMSFNRTIQVTPGTVTPTPTPHAPIRH